MSTLPDPNQDPAAERALTAREDAILAEIAGRENASDPGFVTRLGAAKVSDARPVTVEEAAARARVRDRAVQVLVVVALAALLLPATWFATAVLMFSLLVVPAGLVAIAWREQRAARNGSGPGDSEASPDR